MCHLNKITTGKIREVFTLLEKAFNMFNLLNCGKKFHSYGACESVALACFVIGNFIKSDTCD